MEQEKFTSFNQIFDDYRNIISDENLCIENQIKASIFSLLIDAYSMSKIIDFFNENIDMTRNCGLWKSNLFAIRNFSVITSEIIKYLDDNQYIDCAQFKEPNSLKSMGDLRNKIHQFRRQDFDKYINNIDSNMGRSRNKFSPHLDIVLEYAVDSHNKKIFMGTNMFQFHFFEAKNQITVNFMQDVIRTVSTILSLPSSDFALKRSSEYIKYQHKSYCYTDIINNSKIKNERLIDRLLFALDDLCCLQEFFIYLISIDDYLLESPYMIYFLSKTIAITLDETFDNLNSYVINSNNSFEKKQVEKVTENIDKEFIKYCKILRNNLHYQEQTSIRLGTDKELHGFLLQELVVIKDLLNNIKSLLNINPNKIKLTLYQFLRWVQYSDNEIQKL